MSDRDYRVIARATRTLLPVWLIAAWPAIQWALVNIVLPLLQAWLASRASRMGAGPLLADVLAGQSAGDPRLLAALERAERAEGPRA